jgi:hypothetical protein
MTKTQLTDLLFSGVAVLPAGLTVAGQIDMAMLVFCPLLIAACLSGVDTETHPSE